MPYLNRQTSRRTAGSAELLYLLIVLVAGVGTAMYASQKIGTNLSSVTTVASVLGLTRTAQPLRYDPQHVAAPQIAAPSETLVNANEAAVTGDAPFCAPGQQPSFALGL